MSTPYEGICAVLVAHFSQLKQEIHVQLEHEQPSALPASHKHSLYKLKTIGLLNWPFTESTASAQYMWLLCVRTALQIYRSLEAI